VTTNQTTEIIILLICIAGFFTTIIYNTGWLAAVFFLIFAAVLFDVERI
jgi:hypothetical protein